MKKVLLAGFLLAGIFGATAQTISVTSATPTSTTVGGSSSVRVGTLAGSSLTTGAGNVFVGNNSGYSNTLGAANSFIGADAGKVNTSGSNNAFIGGNAGYMNNSGSNNVFTGVNCGYNNTASNNAFYGYMTGFNNTTGTNNAFFGFQSGSANTIGAQNTFIGSSAGGANTTGTDNTYVGWGTAPANSTGAYNSIFGRSAGNANATGNNNTILGAMAGLNATGSANVFLGFGAGYNETGNNLLYIDNSSTASPLIWGDFANDQVKLNGKVGIGAAFGTFPTTAGSANVSAYNLFVKGGILTDEVRVALNTTWADYVFAKDYNLRPLAEVEAFIAKNKHLPNVPSAKQVKEEGIELADMARIQQEKIEELTLYIIAQNKRIEALEAKMNNK